MSLSAEACHWLTLPASPARYRLMPALCRHFLTEHSLQARSLSRRNWQQDAARRATSVREHHSFGKFNYPDGQWYYGPSSGQDWRRLTARKAVTT